jgi:hypothetical protein
MTVRIYKPARTAMQSRTAKTKERVLDYEPEQRRAIEPLMGWTSSGDMKQQLRLQFDTKDEAVAVGAAGAWRLVLYSRRLVRDRRRNDDRLLGGVDELHA